MWLCSLGFADDREYEVIPVFDEKVSQFWTNLSFSWPNNLPVIEIRAFLIRNFPGIEQSWSFPVWKTFSNSIFYPPFYPSFPLQQWRHRRLKWSRRTLLSFQAIKTIGETCTSAWKQAHFTGRAIRKWICIEDRHTYTHTQLRVHKWDWWLTHTFFFFDESFIFYTLTHATASQQMRLRGKTGKMNSLSVEKWEKKNFFSWQK